MIEKAEGFSIGPATTVGVIAALIILLLTFGSLIAAGMPLITAGLGLITGIALIGLATHVTSMSNIAPELAMMIGLGVGIDYALFIVTRFRENYFAQRRHTSVDHGAMDTSGRAILLAGATVVIALLGHVRHRRDLPVRAVDRVGGGGAVGARRVADRAARAAGAFGHRVVRPTRRARRREAKGEPPRRVDAGGAGASPCRSDRGRWRSSRWP